MVRGDLLQPGFSLLLTYFLTMRLNISSKRDYKVMIAIFGSKIDWKGDRRVPQARSDRQSAAIRSVAPQKVRCFRMLIAIEYVKLLVSGGREELACRGFPDPCLADEEGRFVVLKAPFQEVVSAACRAKGVTSIFQDTSEYDQQRTFF